MHLTSAFYTPGIWDGRAVIASSFSELSIKPSVFRCDLHLIDLFDPYFVLFHRITSSHKVQVHQSRPYLNGDWPIQRGMMLCHIYSQTLGASRQIA